MCSDLILWYEKCFETWDLQLHTIIREFFYYEFFYEKSKIWHDQIADQSKIADLEIHDSVLRFSENFGPRFLLLAHR